MILDELASRMMIELDETWPDYPGVAASPLPGPQMRHAMMLALMGTKTNRYNPVQRVYLWTYLWAFRRRYRREIEHIYVDGIGMIIVKGETC